MMSKTDLRKSLPRDRWGEFFDQFSDGNRGRHISIEMINSALGSEELIQNSPLIAVIYDHPRKRNDLVIEVGRDQMTVGHIVYSPTEVFMEQNSNGQIITICISDAAQSQTLIRLQAT
jgi:Family of unknown function (DUF5335)